MKQGKVSRSVVLSAVAVVFGTFGVSAQESGGWGTIKPYTVFLNALRGPSMTDVYIKVVPVSGVAVPAKADKIQLKATQDKGKWAKNYDDVDLTPIDSDGNGSADCGLASLSFGDLPVYAGLSAQVNVKTPDSQNNEVLRANAVVLAGPHLVIEKIVAPQTILEQETATILVQVAEVKQHSGATFSVSLREGSAELQRMDNVVIHRMASSIALVEFNQQLGVGTHNLTAVVLNSDPAEYDTENNSASFAVQAAESIELSAMTYEFHFDRREGFQSTLSEFKLDERYETEDPVIERHSEELVKFTYTYATNWMNIEWRSEQVLSGSLDFAAKFLISQDSNAQITVEERNVGENREATSDGIVQYQRETQFHRTAGQGSSVATYEYQIQDWEPLSEGETGSYWERFFPDDSTLVTVRSVGGISVCRIYRDSGEVINRTQGYTGSEYSVAYYPDGVEVVLADGETAPFEFTESYTAGNGEVWPAPDRIKAHLSLISANAAMGGWTANHAMIQQAGFHGLPEDRPFNVRILHISTYGEDWYFGTEWGVRGLWHRGDDIEYRFLDVAGVTTP